MICHCSLAGTQACWRCPNNAGYRPYWPQEYVPPTWHPSFDPRPIDLDELARKIADLLRDEKK